ncbi:hypothetical protein MJO28_006729 [Puccinia striiformis f. sp. tritici]|uniref:Uncharacterized protein n=1 Tax=Puccinia striiformis f. sp. tritici TaxID=168172 RepID=A0ACC0EHN5_9BASI|nr:hypothetical protein MJO28_006729 [Puccinia striiformis f. sp. tritici]
MIRQATQTKRRSHKRSCESDGPIEIVHTPLECTLYGKPVRLGERPDRLGVIISPSIAKTRFGVRVQKPPIASASGQSLKACRLLGLAVERSAYWMLLWRRSDCLPHKYEAGHGQQSIEVPHPSRLEEYIFKPRNLRLTVWTGEVDHNSHRRRRSVRPSQFPAISRTVH